jgi:hypothetical protein
MKKRHFAAATATFVVALFATSTAIAGGWDSVCGRCGFGGYPAAAIRYATPTYTYAPPKITIVPQYIVQQNYVVRRTYVIRSTRFIDESPAACLFLCGPRYVVNQGQFQAEAVVNQPVGEGAEWAGYSSGYVRTYAHHYYHRSSLYVSRSNGPHYRRPYRVHH